MREAFGDPKNMNAEKLFKAVSAAMKRFPLAYYNPKKRQKKRITEVHNLSINVVTRKKDKPRLNIYVPKRLQYDVYRDVERKYLYLHLVEGSDCNATNPEFVKFVEAHVHTATDGMSDAQLSEWIHSDYDKADEHPIFEHIRNLWQKRAQKKQTTETQAEKVTVNLTSGTDVTIRHVNSNTRSM